MGGSHGGSTTLASMLAADSDTAPLAAEKRAGAHHSFDSANPIRYVATRINGNAPGGRGATTGGDPQAWADAIREVVAFFGTHLKER
jgi:dienelactone hydrolase